MSLLHEIWLCEFCKYEPETIYKYLGIFGSAENAFKAKESDYKKSEYYSYLKKFFDKKRTLDSAEKLVEECKRLDIHIMSINDSDYSEQLKNSYLPPRILFIKGERFNFNDYLFISVVGSRVSSRNGRMMANQLCRDLVKCGIIVVSGLAIGIDAEAQKGAIEGGGRTVAFLSGGVDMIYPAENRKLYEQILENGAVVSERPPGTVGRKYFYQHRNRLMAGIAHGIVVVEGTMQSGTSITVKHATDFSRDIFAVPGSPISEQYDLPNSLIRDGAPPVLSFEDIVRHYDNRDDCINLLENGMKLLKNPEAAYSATLNYEFDKEDEIILKYLQSCGDAQLPDDISEHCNIPVHTVSSKLTMLMISDFVIQEPGNKYILTRRDLF
ncbi:MAG: DNA-protecting protein DprA [Ruminococcaceae bacterium]|nr:DNA-protecting protein DprA [Oscillospiraceae bacterium]